MTYEAAEDFLFALPRFAMEGNAAYAPGLERIGAVLEAMGNPHRSYPIVHIAGTNGKGSTASFLAAIATASGRKTGLHTSPHLYRMNERLRVDGEPAPGEWIVEAVERYRAVFEKEKVSFFEAMVALSFQYFAHQSVDLAVIEVGLGGRFDATNIVSPELAIVTSISLDHTQILGNSIRDIAREKAGIVKPHIPVLSGVKQSDAVEEIQKAAAQMEAKFVSLDEAVEWSVVGESGYKSTIKASTARQEYQSLTIGLPGPHQCRNALLALLAAEKLFVSENRLDAFIAEGLANVAALSGLKGRMEVVKEEPLVVLDVGHNLDGLRAAVTFMLDAVSGRQGHLFVMFGTMRDKDIHQMVKHLAGIGVKVYTPPIHSDRAVPSTELATTLRSHDINVEHVLSLEEGLFRFSKESTHKDGLLIVGSHYLVAQYNRLIDL